MLDTPMHWVHWNTQLSPSHLKWALILKFQAHFCCKKKKNATRLVKTAEAPKIIDLIQFREAEDKEELKLELRKWNSELQMAVVVGSCCFSVLNSTVKFRGSLTSQRLFATPQRSIGSITPKAINHRRRASSPKRGSSSSSSSSSSNSKSNGEVNPLSHSLSSYVCLCIFMRLGVNLVQNANFIFEAIIVTLSI